MRVRVFVSPREGVLDPAGEAVRTGLQHLGYHEVSAVRGGRFFDVDVTDAPDALARVEKMADQLLANPVIESYRLEVIG